MGQAQPAQNKNQKRNVFIEKLKVIGPGAIIAASFVGPGTITTATEAGASFGYALLWALVFSVITTIVLQMMVARLGIISRKGLGAAIRDQFSHPAIKYSIVVFVILSIFTGSAAYMSGDLNGTSLGLSTLTGWNINAIGPFVGLVVLLIGLSGSYKLIEKMMIGLVIIMSAVFITTMVIAQPDLGGIASGMFAPSIPVGSIITIAALIGTTVVPYNLFIHSTSVQERWNHPSQLKDSKWDIVVSIGLGGLISASILITSGTLMRGVEVETVADLALQLEPLLGGWAESFLAIGIFSAGFSSMTAAALGASITIASILKWKDGLKDWRFKAVFTTVIVIGILSFTFNVEPLAVILFAQALNGILLPGIAVLILIIMNNKQLLGKYTNSLKVNIIGGIVVIVCIGIGAYSLFTAISDLVG
ncbi:Nramp family divalent metal transporter [Alteribacter natronophilus]|uniref:Nramp family divalent metal transporter n=1 Tax=Alteribacter natronophilus TaxID=2583810 RepID=UPI00110DC9CF|nr:Nramp family divalent metal transporter [Alteribacter natronophilus]TMW72281.1 divalent metal cation transporter [Alteribacter natronophilus]